MEILMIIELIIILVVLIRNMYLNEKMDRDIKLYNKYLDIINEEQNKVYKQNKELKAKLEEEKNKVNELKIKLEEEKDNTKKSKTKNDNKIKKLSNDYEELLKKYNLLNSIEETNNKEQEEKQEEKQEGKLEEEPKKMTKNIRKTKKIREKNGIDN